MKARLSAKENPENTTFKLKANLLTTFIGEADKGTTMVKGEKVQINDDTTVALVKKFIKNTNELLTSAELGSQVQAVGLIEIQILESYLPEQLDEFQLREIVQGEIDAAGGPDPKLMGRIMGTLNKGYKGKFDGRLASNITKELLNK